MGNRLMCQDTGMIVIFVRLDQYAFLEGDRMQRGQATIEAAHKKIAEFAAIGGRSAAIANR